MPMSKRFLTFIAVVCFQATIAFSQDQNVGIQCRGRDYPDSITVGPITSTGIGGDYYIDTTTTTYDCDSVTRKTYVSGTYTFSESFIPSNVYATYARRYFWESLNKGVTLTTTLKESVKMTPLPLPIGGMKAVGSVSLQTTPPGFPLPNSFSGSYIVSVDQGMDAKNPDLITRYRSAYYGIYNKDSDTRLASASFRSDSGIIANGVQPMAVRCSERYGNAKVLSFTITPKEQQGLALQACGRQISDMGTLLRGTRAFADILNKALYLRIAGN
jgi:hypothetical protein